MIEIYKMDYLPNYFYTNRYLSLNPYVTGLII